MLGYFLEYLYIHFLLQIISLHQMCWYTSSSNTCYAFIWFTLISCHLLLYVVYTRDVSSGKSPWPRGSSRTECHGLGLDHQVIGLGLRRQVLGLEPLALEIKFTTFSFALNYCLHSSVNELMKVRIITYSSVFNPCRTYLSFNPAIFMLAE